MADPVIPLINERMKARFWAKLDKRGPDDCWPWMASGNRGGYGQFILKAGLIRRAHQMALYLSGSPRPDYLHALHSCDNRRCCNPAHLRWGTIAENAQDKSRRGRCPDTAGERNAHAKLTEQDVRDIRESTEPQRTLAARYGLKSHTTVGRIKRGEKWRCVE